MIQETEHFSFKVGELAKGCKLCVDGKKLVLFITGVCPRNCWYCPIADNKVQADVIYANEQKILTIQEAIKEAKLCSSEGVGITGGDPLTRIDRCVQYIKALKQEFGQKFHVHLYTSFNLVNESNLNKLYNAGLDEIRFHPDFSDRKYWSKIEIARKFNWNIGIEIPCIPNFKKEIEEIIEFFKDKVDFLNLNELEAADSDKNKVFEMGYKSRDTYSYGIKGSEELALKIMRKYKNLNIHFCTSRLKNLEQLGNRIKLRANNIKKDYDIITEGGSLIRGAIYLQKPPFVKLSKNLDKIKKEVVNLGIASDKLDIDTNKQRILTSVDIVRKHKNKLKIIGLFPAIVEELATGDLFEIEIEYL